MNSNVLGRTVHDKISDSAFNLIIGMTLLWGFAVNWWMVANIDPAQIMAVNKWVFFGGYFASCIGGILLYKASKTPLLSFIGYNMVVVPFGLVVNLVVSKHNPDIVLNAIQMTAAVTLAMMFLGATYPKFFQSISGGLFIALLVVIVFELVAMLVFGKRFEITDWAVAIIFCGYIGYDWGVANQMPKTVDNAIDGAADLYMDIINLFIRILEIMGRAK